MDGGNRYYLTLGLGRFTGVVTTGAIFAMRAGASKVLRVHRIVIQGGFSGVGNAQSTQIIQVKRFSGATHTGGSSRLTSIVKHSSDEPASTVLDAREADITGTAPLTDTNVVYEAAFRNTMLPRTLSGMSALLWSSDLHPEVIIRPGEGLAIFTTASAVVGDSIVGLVCWSENAYV